MRITVCIPTFHRPEGLKRLLEGINKLTFRGKTPVLTIVVVDNDPAGSARKLCEQMSSTLQWPLDYCVEPRRGIAPARNRALSQAAPQAEWLAFVDDDEVPDPQWLDELLLVQRQYDADVVSGPVVARFVEPVPRWIVKGAFFDSPPCQTGRLRGYAYTNNVLFRSEILERLDCPFDERFALTGGEDAHFFRRVSRAGFKIVWAAGAVVREWIPETRARFGWLVRRAFRTGNSMAMIKLDLRPGWPTRLVQAAKGMVWILLGTLRTLCGVVAGRHVLVKGVQWLAYGVGLLLGIAGTRYREYKTTHGT